MIYTPNFLLQLISVTRPEWGSFASIFKGLTGESPTRELDKANIPVGDAGSFAMAVECIDGRFQAIGNLQRGYRGLDFVDFTFLLAFSDGDFLQKFCNLLDIVHVQYMGKHGSGFVMFKGSVKDLKNLIIVGCEIDEYRAVFNRVYDVLCTHGFKTAFPMKQTKDDGSFTFS